MNLAVLKARIETVAVHRRRLDLARNQQISLTVAEAQDELERAVDKLLEVAARDA